MLTINSTVGYQALQQFVDFYLTIGCLPDEKLVKACVMPMLQIEMTWDLPTYLHVDVGYFGMN